MLTDLVAICLFVHVASLPAPEHVSLGQQELHVASRLAASYLVRSIREDGSFVYRLSWRDGRWIDAGGYNILRHAGVIWTLAEYASENSDPLVVSALNAPCKFLTFQMNQLADSPLMVAILETGMDSSGVEAKLGAAGLSLAAFVASNAVDQGIVSLESLRALGRFILYMQRPDGSFNSKVHISSGRFDDWESLYYPGEASLGLIMLWEIDRDSQWLDAAEKALCNLAEKRENAVNIPHDHWALIATERLLKARQISPHNAVLLTRHAEAICRSIIEQAESIALASPGVSLMTADHRSTPTSIRIEGLMSATGILPETSAIVHKARALSARSLSRLIDNQIPVGPLRGAIPRLGYQNERRYNEIRIDYAQHFLGALLRFDMANEPE